MDKKEIAKKYLKQANKNWASIVNTNFLCYEDAELISAIIYELFKKDCFNDIGTYYKYYNENKKGYNLRVLVELEENIYFQFDIITRYGVDIPQKINNGKFLILKNIPNAYKDIWELLPSE